MMRQNSSRRAMILMSLFAAVSGASLVGATETHPASPSGGQRLREGTRLLEVLGRFEAAGDRVSFVFADTGESVRILENLALQRVSRVLAQTPPGTQWTVSGTITEYNNGNYLLLTKAVQAGKTAAKEAAGVSGIGTRAKVDYSKSNQEKSGAKNQESTDVSHP